jgi:hypothetical protein
MRCPESSLATHRLALLDFKIAANGVGLVFCFFLALWLSSLSALVGLESPRPEVGASGFSPH